MSISLFSGVITFDGTVGDFVIGPPGRYALDAISITHWGTEYQNNPGFGFATGMLLAVNNGGFPGDIFAQANLSLILDPSTPTGTLIGTRRCVDIIFPDPMFISLPTSMVAYIDGFSNCLSTTWMIEVSGTYLN